MPLFDAIPNLPHAWGSLASGSQPWSSPEQYVIFSIDDESIEATRDKFTEYLAKLNVSAKPVEGSYKGKIEHSWIVNARDWTWVALSGYLEYQESVLHLGVWRNGGRQAVLYYADHRVQPIGNFVQTTKTYALKQDAWTRDGTDYFICE